MATRIYDVDLRDTDSCFVCPFSEESRRGNNTWICSILREPIEDINERSWLCPLREIVTCDCCKYGKQDGAGYSCQLGNAIVSDGAVTEITYIPTHFCSNGKRRDNNDKEVS